MRAWCKHLREANVQKYKDNVGRFLRCKTIDKPEDVINAQAED